MYFKPISFLQATFDEQIAHIETTLTAERCLREEISSSKNRLATTLQTVEESLTAERDKLRTELDEVNARMETSTQTCINLEQCLASEKSEKEMVLKEKDTLSCTLVDLREVMGTMKKEMTEKDETIASTRVCVCKCIYVCTCESTCRYKRVHIDTHVCT